MQGRNPIKNASSKKVCIVCEKNIECHPGSGNKKMLYIVIMQFAISTLVFAGCVQNYLRQ